MRRNLFIFLCLGLSVSLFSQEKMYIHKSDNITLGAPVSETDSIYFSSDGGIAYFKVGNYSAEYSTSSIDSITFGNNSDTVFITFNGSSISVFNPLAFEGVFVTLNGADVSVSSITETRDIYYSLSGTTTDGSFKMYSDKRYNLLLNGVNITNPDGPAINLQSDKKASVTLMNGTSNSLTDGSTYASAVINASGETEDQSATFFSEGQLLFSGTGSLTINGVGSEQHALGSDNYIEIDEGTITVNSAVKDGIHGKDGVIVKAGTVKVTATGDGIDGGGGYIDISGGNITTINAAADVKGISCDSTMIISGGTINLTISGNQSKGLASSQEMTLSGGTIIIKTSGAAVVENYDPSYCTAIKCDSTITISGADITITGTGAANKGISSDYNLNMTSGKAKITLSGAGATYKSSSTATDAYYGTGISADGNIGILAGEVNILNSGSGGRGFSVDGTLTFGDNSNSPTVSITTSGNSITSGSGRNIVSYAEPKAIKSDLALTINNGTITISSNDDGMKSEASITFNGGTVTISKSVEGVEGPAIYVKNSAIVNIAASDDGFNATKGSGGENNDGSTLTISGGTSSVNVTGGDGMDSNGSISMTGGTVIVQGPSSSPEVGIDCNGDFLISGGTLVASGPNSGTNMIEATSTSSAQYCIKALATTSSSSTNIFHIQDGAGKDICTFNPVRSTYYVVFSSPDLNTSSTYYIYTGGNVTGGTNTNGFYTGGSYSGGTLKTATGFTLTSKVTSVNY